MDATFLKKIDRQLSRWYGKRDRYAQTAILGLLGERVVGHALIESRKYISSLYEGVIINIEYQGADKLGNPDYFVDIIILSIPTGRIIKVDIEVKNRNTENFVNRAEIKDRIVDKSWRENSKKVLVSPEIPLQSPELLEKSGILHITWGKYQVTECCGESYESALRQLITKFNLLFINEIERDMRTYRKPIKPYASPTLLTKKRTDETIEVFYKTAYCHLTYNSIMHIKRAADDLPSYIIKSVRNCFTNKVRCHE